MERSSTGDIGGGVIGENEVEVLVEGSTNLSPLLVNHCVVEHERNSCSGTIDGICRGYAVNWHKLQ